MEQDLCSSSFVLNKKNSQQLLLLQLHFTTTDTHISSHAETHTLSRSARSERAQSTAGKTPWFLMVTRINSLFLTSGENIFITDLQTTET